MSRNIFFIVDFDGVLNYLSSIREHKLATGARCTQKQDIPFGEGSLTITWSAEIVNRLKEIRKKYGAKWFWLSTWQADTPILDKALGIESDRTLAFDYSNSAVSKLKAVLEIAKNYPDSAFVWMDDKATKLFRDGKYTLAAPYLIITPESRYGLSMEHMEQIERFCENINKYY
ncbi:hypothetical protein Dip518_001251 [Parelusimicrobium proximum]|uniref:HAD domain-containing protein n=1 Tax=Parelusimicrobium proximum TaxID=3228953 RepID=UPI003D16377C